MKQSAEQATMREYRYERKFLVEALDAAQVHALVRCHPGMFYEPYPPRYVNNLYLDTQGLDNYFDNINGIGERHKVRIRWYGDLFGEITEPVLEFKVKTELVGAKYSYPFPGFRLDENFSHRLFQELVRASNLPGNLCSYLHSLNVVLCNRYYRRYYASRDRRFRLTVDTGMTYYQVKKVGNRFRFKSVDERIIVELKYEMVLDPKAEKVSSFFPFSVTRNSKYVTGIERVYPKV